jgi:MinD-like ATPase involved in chromosome partitioning or flagellar assembly
MQTITFYSYKGGTGRSLAVANAARYLSNLGFKVVALDFDLEAPGLHYKFAANSGGKPLAVKAGLVDYLDEFSAEGRLPKSLKDFVINVPVPGNAGPPISLIPAGRGPSKEYWTKLARINWHDLLYSEGASGVRLFVDLKNRIAEDLNPDYLLVDSRTGITEMSGIATSLLADRVICLVLPSAENLEGARVVLRSLRRSRREVSCADVQITIALSRRPEEAGSELQDMEIERIGTFMNAEADDLEDTLSCSDVFVLRSESALEREESLRVGTGISPDDSVLLRDYLRLFASFVPRDVVEQKVKILAERAREVIWTDPDAAVKAVEELAAAFVHPESYRVLLQFYAVRGIQGERALRTAERLWDLSREADDPAIWSALAGSYEPRPKYLGEGQWTPDLDFVTAVWRGAGKCDAAFALKLAEGYRGLSRPSKAGDILQEAIVANGPSALLVGRCIWALAKANRQAEAVELASSLGPQFSSDSGFVEEWARYAILFADEASVRFLADAARKPVLWTIDPVVAGLIYVRAGEMSSATARAVDILGLVKKDPGGFKVISAHRVEPSMLVEFFAEVGMLDDLQAVAKGRLPPDFVRRIESAQRDMRT